MIALAEKFTTEWNCEVLKFQSTSKGMFSIQE